MTQSFKRGGLLLRLGRAAAVLALGAAVLVVPASAGAAPDGETAASVTRVDASTWGGSWKKPLRAESAADFPSGNVYCTPSYTAPGCLEQLKGVVEYLGCGTESGGGDVDVVVRNRNKGDAPRDISVFLRDGDDYRMIVGDRDFAHKGRNVIEYRGIPNGTYTVTVGWDDQVLAFYGNAFTVAC